MQSRSFLSQTSVLVMNPGFSISSSLHQSEPQKVTLDSQINKGTNFPSHKDRRFVPRFSHHRSANIIIVFHKTRCYLALNNKWFTRSSHHLEYGGMAIPSPKTMGMNMSTTCKAEHRRITSPPGAGSTRERTPTSTTEAGLNEYISVTGPVAKPQDYN